MTIKPAIHFLSTNPGWGGSEVLWTEAARHFSEAGFKVTYSTFYDQPRIKNFVPDPHSYINLNTRFILPKIGRRLINKLTREQKPEKDYLKIFFEETKPDIVVISQGNNLDGRPFMELCMAMGIPFVTLTHLVYEGFWPALTDQSINHAISLYQTARQNFFVSHATLSMHEKLLGQHFSNNAVVYNPFTKAKVLVPFPHSNDGFRIALIGRLETFHKGYDLLIEVIAKQKWKDRNLHFSVYGTGPHQLLLERMAAEQGITNLHFKGHTDSIEEVWNTHHMLLMPSRIEGQSLTLIEAMRYNRSAIVTNVGGAGELIEDGVCGFIADYPSADAIDSAMERAWESRLEWENFGVRAGEAIGGKHPKNAMADFIEKITKLIAADRNTDKVILP